MKNLFFIIAVLCLSFNINYAQESFEKKAKAISEKIQEVTKEERERLSKEIEGINERMEKNEISTSEAEKLRGEAAKKSAKVIEDRVAGLAEELQSLVQEKVDGKINEEIRDTAIERRNKKSKNGWDWDFDWENKFKKNRGESRTTSQFVFAFGKNMLANNGSFSDIEGDDFKILHSRYYELGLTWNTRLAKNHHLLHLKYGLSFAFNNLRPTDNRYFVVNGDQTVLQKEVVNTFTKKPYFRNIHLVAPVHLEFDFTKPRMKDDQKIFRSHKAFRMGVGGYVGLNISTKQYLQYSNNGYDTEQTIKGDYNVNDLIYGLSGYIGYEEMSLFCRYDLNPLFKKNPVDQNNISIGLRFDFN